MRVFSEMIFCSFFSLTSHAFTLNYTRKLVCSFRPSHVLSHSFIHPLSLSLSLSLSFSVSLSGFTHRFFIRLFSTKREREREKRKREKESPRDPEFQLHHKHADILFYSLTLRWKRKPVMLLTKSSYSSSSFSVLRSNVLRTRTSPDTIVRLLTNPIYKFSLH